MTEHTHSELRFAYASEPFSLADVDVKKLGTATVHGHSVTAAIIGESHYISIPSLDYHELCSCSSVNAANVHRTELECGLTATYSFKTDAVTATTHVTGKPLDAFPGPDGFDMAFRFGPDAFTTLALKSTEYETYHTYPEFDLALHTRTELLPRQSTQSKILQPTQRIDMSIIKGGQTPQFSNRQTRNHD